MAKNAKNLPPQKRDTVNFLYQKAEKLNKLYQEASNAFYVTHNFALAQKKFMEIYNQNNADSLVWFYAKACGDVTTQDMVLIPEGEFFMGDSTAGEKVSLSAFYMSKYEVTHAQYARFLNQYKAQYPIDKARLDSIENDFIDIDGKYSGEMEFGLIKEEGKYKVRLGYENRPLAWVSWYGAAAFCRFYGVKLPTEAQWEYAAGGGNAQYVETTHALSLHGTSVRTQYAGTNNENELPDFAWYDENSGSKTHAVGTRKPNVLGLYDMSGNVWEWCSSWYVDYGEGYLENAENSKKSSYRVLRGGSCYGDAYDCRVAFRSYYNPNDDYYSWGFRFCRTK
jgi:formylglycine-generating enzyme required for sulfatase activity